MATSAFNKEMKSFMNNKNHRTATYLNDLYLKSKQYKSYYSFFDDFLISYGIASFGCFPRLKGNQFDPYIKCQSKNIFLEDEGFKHLSLNPMKHEDGYRYLAKYLIERLGYLNIEHFENWQS